MMFTKATITTLIAAASIVSAAPTGTTTSAPSRTRGEFAVTHTVVAGRGGLKFDPENVVAEIGDVIEWHYAPMNHSVAQSSFAKPCEPLADDTGFFSGFNFAVKEGQSENVFQITVEDKKPIWYYCAQQVGSHCQKGMVGVVNQNFDSNEATLNAHKELAAQTEVSVIPPYVQGGYVIPNPNPLSGF
ncbi:Cupredoxin [Xylariales sp. AK1849]|nr:Cupredoxin [Xylariales sp. AK1849]